ncbi:helix-hairpin-helix domain-containing protein [Listeria booriae]|uniref:Mitomycin resistance protein mcrB n=1 Tax=Listeria booriae TaxID=1552123 RepID=A0A841ZV25_9LIST|nr:helix-hairpin-helix domain-containing protein [Listeria booriae]MBC1565305.1 Mitomycin resistance protein mcrB [Listeria booriae]
MKDELLQIPGIGKRLSEALHNIGVYKMADLNGKNPLHLYELMCEFEGTRVDPCVLYTFRCAIYFVETEEPDPQLLKWWSWKSRAFEREAE